ncbi:hypothetical protein CDL12_11977 [Handroanthus impetiginosus]|uniref:ZF-HD dimerization-type domain-containing protein n=1 Tax=Handroanthus impetiginosus TaxID=429701 RepID=A0A2G9HD45_9LAMI|nr:hypothetical protein CDL12_11977 [Handroanthus impetiginosus]
MEYEDQEEQEGDLGAGPTYADSLGNSNSTRPPTNMLSPTEAPPSPPRKPRYRECLKNHAVGIGGQALDGCREFMPAGEEGTLESLRCAACNCHRNFHRKENEAGVAFPLHQHPHPQQLLLTHHPQGHFGYRGPSGYLHVGPPQQQQRAVPLALPSSSGGGGGSGSMDELEDYYSNPSSVSGKKRFRTKFTQEQKEKMLDLAERLDWKIQKQDEELVQQFCSEVGVKRHVLKVWMHNNKSTLGKKT